MPRLVNPQSLQAAFAELPNQFTLKELKKVALKHKLNFQTMVRQGKKLKVFTSLEYGVYSRVMKIDRSGSMKSEPPKPLMAETVRHLGFIANNFPGSFPLPTINFIVTRVIQPHAPTSTKDINSLEEELLQLRMDLADALLDPSQKEAKGHEDLPHKPTTPKELRELAESYGWVFKRQTGSHHIFKHPGRPDPLAIPNANSNKSIGARASRLIATQILRGTKGQKA